MIDRVGDPMTSMIDVTEQFLEIMADVRPCDVDDGDTYWRVIVTNPVTGQRVNHATRDRKREAIRLADEWALQMIAVATVTAYPSGHVVHVADPFDYEGEGLL
jgi:hypothetical protein